MTGPRGFTRCQLEVAGCLAKGWTYRQVGEWLGIGWESVRTHTKRANDRIPFDFAPDVHPQQRVARYYRERIAQKVA